MHIDPGRRKTIIFAVVSYLIGVVLYAVFTYYQTTQYLIKLVDDKLLTTASLATNTIHNNLHNNLMGDRSITPNEDYLIAMQLQSLAEDFEVEFIYSLVMRGNKILFVSSNPSKNELMSNIYEMVFLSEYPEADQAIYNAFLTGEVQFSEYEDRWGHFRSVFIPLTTKEGKFFVVGVDVKIDEILAAVWSGVNRSLLVAFLLALVGFPLIYFYLRTIKDEANAKVALLYKDPLTGLPNKTQLISDLKYAENGHLALIEIDDFNQIINAIGVVESDGLTVEIAQRLSQLYFEGVNDYQIYVVSPTKFALLIDQYMTQAEIDKHIKYLFDFIVKRRYCLETFNPVSIVVRIGAVKNTSNALLLANMALQKAKEDNKSIVAYDETLIVPYVYKNYLRRNSTFINAIEKGFVKPFYQPILDVNRGDIAKYEVLARVIDDHGKVIMLPSEFMPVAYQSRLCHTLTRQILNTALEDIKYSDFIISINLSVKDLFDSRTFDYIRSKLKATGLGEQVEFELLEQQIIEDYGHAEKAINQLRELGCKVGMDDLGKHYSNFDRLLNLPFDFIKIDGSIISCVEQDDDAKSIARSIIRLAKQKQISVIAEYCDSEAVCNAAISLGADYLQGFHIGEAENGFRTLPLKTTAFSWRR